MKIKNIKAREILDSRGCPTVEATVFLENDLYAKASVPSGASVGKYEACELRDGDQNRYGGKGVLKAVGNVEKIIAPKLIGQDSDFQICDKIMLELDGTENKSSLGANAILSVSMAIARAQALYEKLELYELLKNVSDTSEIKFPSCMFNILNGGAHANNGIDFQEFMIMPKCCDSFSEQLRISVLIYNNLKKLLNENGFSTSVGDEGGFAPKFNKNQNGLERYALDFIMEAVGKSKLEPGKDVVFCLDVAASQFYDSKNHVYKLNGKEFSCDELIKFYGNLIQDYPIYSLEDPLDENDWDGWQNLTKELGEKVQLVGDDIFVSNVNRIKEGIDKKVSNAVLMKPNQVGTVSEILESISECKKNNYKTVVSHRSGETCDTFIADLVVGTNSGQFKCGAPARGERVAKYNRLSEIT